MLAVLTCVNKKSVGVAHLVSHYTINGSWRQFAFWWGRDCPFDNKPMFSGCNKFVISHIMMLIPLRTWCLTGCFRWKHTHNEEIHVWRGGNTETPNSSSFGWPLNCEEGVRCSHSQDRKHHECSYDLFLVDNIAENGRVLELVSNKCLVPGQLLPV